MLSDEALYARLLAGEIAAFDELYRRYESRLFGFVLRQLGDRSEAEDVFHDAFMALLRARRSQHELANFRAWLFQVALNLCHNRVRARRRKARALTLVSRSEESSANGEPDLAARELPLLLERAVEQLPPPLAQLYALRASGLAYDEIADVLQLPLGTVKSRMHQLVARLKKELQAWIAR
jgi:RNA polymerase sigma-70 factor, ECF subfamily